MQLNLTFLGIQLVSWERMRGNRLAKGWHIFLNLHLNLFTPFRFSKDTREHLLTQATFQLFCVFTFTGKYVPIPLPIFHVGILIPPFAVSISRTFIYIPILVTIRHWVVWMITTSLVVYEVHLIPKWLLLWELDPMTCSNNMSSCVMILVMFWFLSWSFYI